MITSKAITADLKNADEARRLKHAAKFGWTSIVW
jgi:hypothetical protein